MATPFDDFISYGKLGWNVISSIWRFWRGRTRRLTPQEKLEQRVKWKPQFEAWILDHNRRKLRHDCIIRDMKRIDHYPNLAEGRGISSWFRVGLIDTYERGIMVGLQWVGLIKEQDGWRFGEYKTENGNMATLMLTGFIPYENIETVDWIGDQYYSEPHIYCYFDFKGQPYERLGYCEKRNLDEFIYYTEIVGDELVRKHTKKLKGRAWMREHGH
jgi:hypothetical protein